MQMTKLVLIGLLFWTGSVSAQQMNMHEMKTSSKNIFLMMMDTMMIKMSNIPAAKSVEANFILEMIPHHEGAVEMAEYEIEHGKDFTMIQLAKSILAEQHIEVQQMRLWLQRPIHDPVKVTECFQKNMDQSMSVMMENMPGKKIPNTIDRAFARIMIPHHQAAIDMARIVIKYGKDGATISFAKQIISSQQIEIEQMLQFLN
jgi:uncharacterized protein (DUF305 family)